MLYRGITTWLPNPNLVYGSAAKALVHPDHREDKTGKDKLANLAKKFEGKCRYCNRKGHKEADCKKKANDDKKKGKGGGKEKKAG